MDQAKDYLEWEKQQANDQTKQQVGVASLLLEQPDMPKPDEMASHLSLGKEYAKITGKPVPPPSMVAQFPSVFQQEIERQKNSTALSSAPRLADWLKNNPDNAPLVVDDVGALASVANALERGLKRVPQSVYQAYANEAFKRSQNEQKSFSELVSQEMSDLDIIPSPGDLGMAAMNYFTSRYSKMTGINNKESAAFWQQQAGRVSKEADAIKMTPGAEAYKTGAGERINAQADMPSAISQFAKEVASDPAGFLSFTAQMGVESLPMMLGVMASRGAFGPVFGAGVAGGLSAMTEAGTSAVEFFQEMGVDVSTPEGAMKAISNPALMKEAERRGIARGVAIGLMDGLGAGIAGQTLAKSKVGNLVLGQIAQAATGSGGEYLAQVTAGEKFKPFDIIMEGVAEALMAPAEMASMGNAKLMESFHRSGEAQQAKEFAAEIAGMAGDSKLRQRSPEVFRNFMENMTGGKPTENMFLPAQKVAEYFQSLNVDPFELWERMEGTSADDLRLAIALGGDVKIPTATYATQIAGSEHDAFLIDHVRFNPESMTAFEATEFNMKAREAIDQARAMAEAQILSEEEFKARDQRIYDVVFSRLREAGQSYEVAQAEASLYPAFFRTMAARAGMSVDEFADRYLVPQVRGDLPKGIQSRNVDELTRTLAEARSFKAVKDRRKGLLEWISDYGGISDPGGELASRDAAVIKQGKGKKTLRLARPVGTDAPGLFGGVGTTKHSIDTVAMAAVEAGYLDGAPLVQQFKSAMETNAPLPDITPVLMAAIDEELAGRKQVSAYDAQSTNADKAEALAQLEEYLNRIGVDLNNTDEEIRAALAQAEGGAVYDQGGDITQTEAFKRWFGDSKVVDAKGKPLVVYHGSPDARGIVGEEGKFQTRKEAMGAQDSGRAYFFTNDRRVAATYADDTRAWDYQNAEPAVVPTYLSIQNPAVIDWGGERWRGTERAIEDARSAGHDGIIIKNVRDAFNAGLVKKGDVSSTVYVAFSPEQIKSVNNRGTFDPNDPRILYQRNGTGPRGSITLPAGGAASGEAVISLFKTANLSTFLHESGHWFLSVMQDVAARGHQETAADYQVVRDWWKVNAEAVAKDAVGAQVTADDVLAVLERGTTGDAVKDAAIDVGFHEQFARGFEAYLMEGKAPSVELRSAFEKFRAWLVSVYRNLMGLNVQPSEELKRVFDRMLATDEEIAKANSRTGIDETMFATAEDMGLTVEQFDAFLKLREQAKAESTAKLLAETMEPIKRERNKWYREERAAVQEEIEKQVNAQPVYRAFEWMGNRRWIGENQPENMPDMRMSKDILIERYGSGVLKTLPRGQFRLYAETGGMDSDDVAGWFGFSSGDQMIQSLENSPPRKEAIKAETDKVMYERHGDPLNDGEVEAKALDAVHSDAQAKVIERELKAIGEVAGVSIDLTHQQARETARQVLTGMRVRDAINSRLFLAAERRASDEAFKLGQAVTRTDLWQRATRRKLSSAVGQAIAEGDSLLAGSVDNLAETAAERTARYNENVSKLIDAKRRQLMNHMLFDESMKVRKEVERAEATAKRLQKASVREKLAGDYLEPIDALLLQYDFRKMSAREEWRRGALLEYVQRMKDEGRENELAIPESVLMNAERTPYKTLSVEDLRGVSDSLANIEHTARLKQKLIDAKAERDLTATVEGIQEAFDANMPKNPPSRVKSRSQELKNLGRQLINTILNASTILREIDGFKDAGSTYQAIKAPIDDAMNRLQVRRGDVAERVKEIYDAHYDLKERRAMEVRKFVPALNESLSKWEMIALALNTGNADNLQRLTDPRVKGSFTREQVTAVLKSLDSKDADFIQSIWDFLDSFRPDIEAREKRLTGVSPKWVKGSEVVIGGKVLKGGYYPLKYDSRLSGLAQMDAETDLAQSMQGGRFSKAQTRNGHLKERGASSGRPVLLDIGVFHRHVNQVIYDLELSEPVANSWRILRDNRVGEAFRNAGRQADMDALQVWLKDIAEGEVAASEGLGRVIRAGRTNFTLAKLSFNIGTVLLQATGAVQSMVVVGKKDFLRGVIASTDMEKRRLVVEKSSFMANRQSTFNRDIQDLVSDSSRINFTKTGQIVGSGLAAVGKGAEAVGLKKTAEAAKIASAKAETSGVKAALAPIGMALMVKTQFHVVDVPTWLGGYMQGLDLYKGDDAKAISHADQIVTRAQGSGLMQDKSAIERGSISKNIRQDEFVKLFSVLGSYMFTKFNRAYERSKVAGRIIENEGASIRSGQEALSWTVDMLGLFTLEAIMLAAIKGQLPSGDDEDDTWAKFLMKETAMGVMSTMPVVRDVGSVLKGFSSGGAYGGFLADIGNLAKQINQGEIDKALVKSGINVVGLATGLPSTQTNRFVDAGWRQMEGDDVMPIEYLLGKFGKPGK